MDEVEILLFEDNPDDVALISRALTKANLANKIKVIGDGSDALEYILGNGSNKRGSIGIDKPRVILLDLKLPRVSGLELLQAIKNNDDTKTIPVVVLTSSDEPLDLEQCYKLGVNSYIRKPIQFEHFVKVVADLGMYWLLLNKLPGR
jgi:CheY-like chemotaxis protein